jgi:hypothetical protein
VANFLFINRGGRRFEEVGLSAGVAFGKGGNARSGMGVDSADFDQGLLVFSCFDSLNLSTAPFVPKKLSRLLRKPANYVYKGFMKSASEIACLRDVQRHKWADLKLSPVTAAVCIRMQNILANWAIEYLYFPCSNGCNRNDFGAQSD